MSEPGTGTSVRHPLVRGEGLTFAYGKRAVFRDVTFEIRAGELVALCGPNGAGKSTLLRVLVGMQRSRAGQVFLGGDPVAGSRAARSLGGQRCFRRTHRSSCR